MVTILYNSNANNHHAEECIAGLRDKFPAEDVTCREMTVTEDLRPLMDTLRGEDKLVIAGGDGTLNRFINRIDDKVYPFPIYFYPAGSGNDFAHDVLGEGKRDLILINEYLHDLPTVTVNGETYKYINGIGYGIDGYCCEVGDKLRAKSADKPVNYAGIAIKGLLFHYKPTNATVIVDGEEHHYKKVWLAPTMNGRYYGGGMNIAPTQSRLGNEGTQTVVLLHGSGKIKTLVVFPSIFKGEHIRHTEMCAMHTGREITVRFDRPTALQIDGETILGVTEYTVHAGAKVPAGAQD